MRVAELIDLLAKYPNNLPVRLATAKGNLEIVLDYLGDNEDCVWLDLCTEEITYERNPYDPEEFRDKRP